MEDIRAQVKEYYGKELKSTKDLKTNACCSLEDLPEEHRGILRLIDKEVKDKFYGCGSPIASVLKGKTVLDLGCGSGRDVYLASALVGASGEVIGVDMTQEQLAVAEKHVEGHMKKFGFSEANVTFKHGLIEDLRSLGVEDCSVDVVMSNCVINLASDKPKVFKEIFRVLKAGGELFFSDIFVDRRLPQEVSGDPVLYGECLGGALYIEDFRRILSKLGINEYRVVRSSAVTVGKPSLKAKIGDARFKSMTIRAFNLPVEDRCEDYGQVAVYEGGINEFPSSFVLDDHHVFPKGKAIPICGNTGLMLSATRYKDHFKVIGDRSTHCGEFVCTAEKEQSKQHGGCC